MKIKSPKSNWIMDAGLFVLLLASFWLDLTGLTFHQWLGAVLAAGIGVHFLTHWSWVKTISARFFGHTSGQARRYYLLDASLLLSFTLITLTGLVISTWLGLTLTNYSFWRDLHVGSSIFALLVLVVKIALHWRWVINVAHRYIISPRVSAPRPELHPAQARLAVVPVNTERREFLRLMGLVGVAALVSIANVADSDEQAVASAYADDQATGSAGDSTSEIVPELPEAGSSSSISSGGLSLSSSTDPTQCRVECNKRCSYPGHCRRYVDSNGNNRCDHGECI
ncbi:MAG TPA: DUF4405 domain-containing protein [Anaerolineales bacterium]|nr:DUF4405 domain-containing protein [Anaerolineales bacterium]